MDIEQILEVLQKHSITVDDFVNKKQISIPDYNWKKLADEILSLSLARKQKKVYLAPSKEEFIKYFADNNYQIIVGERAYKHYEAGKNSKGEWTDINGKLVKDWKRKVSLNWFTDNNKVLKLQTNMGGMVR